MLPNIETAQSLPYTPHIKAFRENLGHEEESNIQYQGEGGTFYVLSIEGTKDVYKISKKTKEEIHAKMIQQIDETEDVDPQIINIMNSCLAKYKKIFGSENILKTEVLQTAPEEKYYIVKQEKAKETLSSRNTSDLSPQELEEIIHLLIKARKGFSEGMNLDLGGKKINESGVFSILRKSTKVRALKHVASILLIIREAISPENFMYNEEGKLLFSDTIDPFTKKDFNENVFARKQRAMSNEIAITFYKYLLLKTKIKKRITKLPKS